MLYLVWDSESEIDRDMTMLAKTMTAVDDDDSSDSCPTKKAKTKKRKRSPTESASASEASEIFRAANIGFSFVHDAHFSSVARNQHQPAQSTGVGRPFGSLFALDPFKVGLAKLIKP